MNMQAKTTVNQVNFNRHIKAIEEIKTWSCIKSLPHINFMFKDFILYCF